MTSRTRRARHTRAPAHSRVPRAQAPSKRNLRFCFFRIRTSCAVVRADWRLYERTGSSMQKRQRSSITAIDGACEACSTVRLRSPVQKIKISDGGVGSRHSTVSRRSGQTCESGAAGHQTGWRFPGPGFERVPSPSKLSSERLSSPSTTERRSPPRWRTGPSHVGPRGTRSPSDDEAIDGDCEACSTISPLGSDGARAPGTRL